MPPANADMPPALYACHFPSPCMTPPPLPPTPFCPPTLLPVCLPAHSLFCPPTLSSNPPLHLPALLSVCLPDHSLFCLPTISSNPPLPHTATRSVTRSIRHPTLCLTARPCAAQGHPSAHGMLDGPCTAAATRRRHQPSPVLIHVLSAATPPVPIACQWPPPTPHHLCHPYHPFPVPT